MGTDIHIAVEVRNPEGGWTSADEWESEIENEGTPEQYTSWHIPYEKQIYTGRNYDLFAILANVRNGTGFAGVKTGDGFNVIADPRGLPEDCDERIREWSDWGHSHSWLTLAEILAFDWTQTTVLEGDLHWETFERWSQWERGRGESPELWAGWSSGEKRLTMEEADECLGRLREARRTLHSLRDASEEERVRAESVVKTLEAEYKPFIIRCRWTQFYYQCAANFWATAIPRLLRYGKPEDVRIVFFFDS